MEMVFDDGGANEKPTDLNKTTIQKQKHIADSKARYASWTV